MPRSAREKPRFLFSECLSLVLSWSLLVSPTFATPLEARRALLLPGRTSKPALLPVPSQPASINNGDNGTGRERYTCKDFNINATPVLTHRNPEADKWGDITVAQPKIWQFERVSALLDGLLRDVEGISLGDPCSPVPHVAPPGLR